VCARRWSACFYPALVLWLDQSNALKANRSSVGDEDGHKIYSALFIQGAFISLAFNVNYWRPSFDYKYFYLRAVRV